MFPIGGNLKMNIFFGTGYLSGSYGANDHKISQDDMR